MDVDSLTIALSMTTLGLVLLVAVREYLATEAQLRRRRSERR